jgi:hypothetical protein
MILRDRVGGGGTVYPLRFGAPLFSFEFALDLRRVAGTFSGREFAPDIEADGGDNGRYEESEFAGEGLVAGLLSVAVPLIAAGGRANDVSIWPNGEFELGALPKISVEGPGVGRE